MSPGSDHEAMGEINEKIFFFAFLVQQKMESNGTDYNGRHGVVIILGMIGWCILPR